MPCPRRVKSRPATKRRCRTLPRARSPSAVRRRPGRRNVPCSPKAANSRGRVALPSSAMSRSAAKRPGSPRSPSPPRRQRPRVRPRSPYRGRRRTSRPHPAAPPRTAPMTALRSALDRAAFRARCRGRLKDARRAPYRATLRGVRALGKGDRRARGRNALRDPGRAARTAPTGRYAAVRRDPHADPYRAVRRAPVGALGPPGGFPCLPRARGPVELPEGRRAAALEARRQVLMGIATRPTPPPERGTTDPYRQDRRLQGDSRPGRVRSRTAVPSSPAGSGSRPACGRRD